MAFDTNFRTTQEYLNLKAGFTGTLRTKQECLASLSGRTNATNSVITEQLQANSYAGVTTKTVQDAMNNKVGATANTLTLQEAVRRL
jgi:hypothetical protein